MQWGRSGRPKTRPASRDWGLKRKNVLYLDLGVGGLGELDELLVHDVGVLAAGGGGGLGWLASRMWDTRTCG